jgi:hypothetical protein
MNQGNIDQDFSQITELVKLICDIRANWADNGYHMCWFRGSNTTYSLMPGQYRPSYQKLFGEDSTFYEFQQKARGFLNRNVNSWELFFLMQHYRVPTRLLDWTENAFVALYFALTEQTEEGDPCVWMLNPLLFNERNTPQPGRPYIAVNPDSSDPSLKYWINAYHPLNFNPNEQTFTDSNGKTAVIGNPVAIYPPTVDPRIVAQCSVFTLHGSRQDPIETCCEGQSERKSNFIRKFIFKGISHEVLRELQCFGIRRYAIFPDLEGLGLEIGERLTIK